MIDDNILKLEFNNSTPRYEQLRSYYADLIRNNIIANGEKIPSVYNLARIAGVSDVTIRRVFKELTDKGYLESKSTGSYTSDRYIQAGFKQIGKGNNIGILFPNQLNYTNKLDQNNSTWTWSILSVIQETLSKNGYICSLLTVRGEEIKKGIIDTSNFVPMAGYISFPDYIDGEVIHFLENLGKPFVLINRWNSNITKNYISCDYVNQGKKAAELLIKTGFKCFVVLDNQNFLNFSSREKQKGFVEELLKHGFKLSDVTVNYNLEITLTSVHEKKILELFKEKKKLGIFVLNDSIGISIYNLSLKHGFNIPRDISIIGSGGDMERFSTVPLTIVKQPMAEIGKKAADTIIKMVNGKFKYFNGIKLKTKLIRGNTTLS